MIDKSKILISNFNVNGIRAVEKTKSLSKYLAEQQPDIVVLNELKSDEQKLLDSKILDSLREQYPVIIYSCCQAPLSGYAGVAMLSKYPPLAYQLELPGHD